MKNSGYFFLLLFLISCTTNSVTENYQKNRNKILNVVSKLHKITLGDVMIGSNARVFIIVDKLIVSDYKSYDKQMHLFNKNDYTYLTSFAQKGEGSNEITNIGYVAADEYYIYSRRRGFGPSEWMF